jgi:hypothetical protein
MRSTIRRVVVALVFLLSFTVTARAADDVQVSEPAVRTLGSQTILYREVETSLSEMGEAITPILQDLEKLVTEKKVVRAGDTIFIYQGLTQDPTKKFKVQVSFAVPDGTEPQGDFKVRKLDPFKCVTVLHGGPIPTIPRAYEKAYAGLAGSTPTGETREYYLHFEGVESPNNVQVVAVGVK